MAQATMTPDEVMNAARERFKESLADIEQRRNALAEEERALRQENRAVEAYWSVKEGKPASTSRGNGGVRSPRGARSQTILAMIAGSDGMTRAQILEETGVKGDKKQEGSISNALTNMKKKGELTLTGGVYRAI
jgi:hypothetical protein